MNIKSLFIRLFFGLGFIIIGIGFLLNYHYDIDISGYILPGLIIFIGLEIIIYSFICNKFGLEDKQKNIEIIPLLKVLCPSCKKDIDLEYYKVIPGRAIECGNCNKKYKIRDNVEEKIFKVKNELSEILEEMD